MVVFGVVGNDHLRTGHALRHQQHPIQAVIIARFFRTANLVCRAKPWSRHQQFAVVSCLHETTSLYYAQLLMTLGF
jgi:hypothetical protein